MNHIYRLKRSGCTQQLQPVPETARSAGKGQTRTAKTLAQTVAATVASVALGGMVSLAHAQQAPPAANQLPQGGVVSRGVANINVNAGTALMTVNQSSQRAVIDWASFNVGSQAKVQFNQPSSSAVVLNQILGNNASQIYGQISANGQVFLSNPNGVYFSPTAQVDVGGLVATTGKANADNFMAGKATFKREGSTASVVNEGRLQAAAGGYIALLAPEVRNQGVVVAQAGTVALATGEAITLNFNQSGTGLAGITTTAQAIAALVENRSAVLAEGGQIILSAHALATLQGAVVKNSGRLSATSLVDKGGKIVLTGDSIELTATSQIDANGPAGGGTVLVGGDWQGSGDTRQATQVSMAQGASIEANATQQGDGGKVVLWSDIRKADSVTRVEGRIEAKASGTGQGGQVETSGHQLSISDSAQVGTSGGLWLLDPMDVSIGTTDATVANSGGTFTGTGLGNSYTVSATSVSNALNSNTNVSITTNGTGTGGAGNITLNTSLTVSPAAGRTLTLQAAGGITNTGSYGINNTGANMLTLVLDQAGTSAITGNIQGAIALQKLGVGTLSMEGTSNNYSGGTTISAGVLQEKYGNLSLPTGAVVNNAILQFTNTLSYTISNDISGSGVVKGGSGTLTLSGNNSYTGGTVIGTGGVTLGSQNAIGSTGTITFAGGSGGALTYGSYATDYSARFDNSTASQTFNFNVPLGLSVTLASDFGAPTSALYKQGSGTLRLTGNVAITGNTTLGNGGTLQIGGSGQLNSGNYAGSFIGSGVFQYSSSATQTLSGIFTGASPVIKDTSASSTLILTGASTGTNVIGSISVSAGTLQIAGTGALRPSYNGTITISNGGVFQYSSSVAQTLVGTITGTGGSLVKDTSASVLTLQGPNTYTGTTTISAGTLSFTGNSGYSTSIPPGNFVNNATLELNSSNLSLTVPGVISGTGNLSIKGNPNYSVTLQGDNTFSGGVTLNSMNTLVVGRSSTGSAGAVTSGPLGTGVVTGAASSALLDLAGYTIANTFTSTVSGGSSPPGLGSSTGTSEFQGLLDLSVQGKTISLKPSAGSTLKLTGALTQFDETTSTATKLVFLGAGTVNASFSSVDNSGILYLDSTATGTYKFGNAATANKTYINMNGGTLDLAGQNLSPATETKSITNYFNSGTLMNSASTASNVLGKAFIVANGASYAVTVNTPNVGGDIYWGFNQTTGYWAYNSGATLTKTGLGDLHMLPFPNNVAGHYYEPSVVLTGGNLYYDRSVAAGADTLQASSYSLAAGSNLYINSASSMSVSGTITGAGGVVVMKNATLQGVNTFSGGTTVLNGATLTLNRAPVMSGSTITSGPLGTGTLTLGDASTAATLSLQGYSVPNNVVLNGNATVTTSGTTSVLSGSISDGINAGKSLTLASGTSGILEVSGNNSYTGPTSIGTGSSYGAVVLSHANALGAAAQGTTVVSGSLKLKGGITVSEPITLNASAQLGNLSGDNAVSSTVTLAGASTVIGSDAGTLSLTPASGDAILGSTYAYTLQGNASTANVNVDGKISGSGAITVNSTFSTTGRVKLSGDNDFTGAVSVNYGILQVASNNALGATSAGTTLGGTATLEIGGLASPSGLAIGTEPLTVNSGGLIHNVAGYNTYAGAMTLYGNATITVDTGTSLNFTKNTAVAVPGASRITLNVTDGDLTLAKGLSGSASGSYLRTGSGTLSMGTGNFGSLTPVTGVYIGLYDPTGTDYSSVYGSTPDLTYSFFTSTSGVTPVTVLSPTGTAVWTGTKPVAGTAVGNYSLTYSSGITFTDNRYAYVGPTTAKNWSITAKPITLTGLTVPSSKVYDGSTGATVTTGTLGLLAAESLGTGTASDGKPYTGDVIPISGSAIGNYNSKDVATANLVTFSGLTTTNANYTLIGSQAATITAKPLTVQGLLVPASKVYDATTTAVVSGTASLLASEAVGAGSASDGMPYTGDSIVIIGTATGSYNSKNVVSANLVTFGGLSSSNSNYTVVGSQAASITPAALIISGITASNKTYDGNTSATVSTAGVQKTGLISGDVVSVAATGTFADANAGSKTVNLVSSYSGADVANYAITDQATTSATISAKVLGLNVPGATRVYDATTAITPTGAITLTGVVGTDDVSIGAGSVTGFVDKNVGVNKPVIHTGLTLAGTAAGNYSLPAQPVSTASITQADLQVTGVVGVNRVYDTTTMATLSGTPVVTALLTDVVAVSGAGTGVFADKNAGNNKPLTVTGYTLSGTDAGNYRVLQPAGVSANITPADLQITGVMAANKVYNANTAATLVGTATVAALGSDVVTVNATGIAVFSDKNVGTGKAVTVTGYSLSGADAGNYTALQPSGLSANITPAALQVSGLTVDNKVYDGTTVATVSTAGLVKTGLMGSDQVTVSVTGAFDNKDAGNGKTVNLTSTYAGADAVNYTITGQASATANITQAALLVRASNATKTYDGQAYSGGNGVSYSGFANNETSAVLGGTLSYGGTSQGAVNVANYVITPSGLTSNNYTISYADGALSVNPAPVVATPITSISGSLRGSVSKVYDGTTVATLMGSNYVLTGWVGNDSATVTKTTGTYDSASAGAGKTVTVTLAASDYQANNGTNLSNYILPSTIQGAVGSITKAPLTVSANNAGKTYDAMAFGGGNGVSYSGFVNNETAAVLGGALAYGGSAQGAVHAGTYTISPLGLSSGNYSIAYRDGVLTIDPATVEVKPVTSIAGVLQGTVSKTYDGTTVATLSSGNYQLSGWMGADGAMVTKTTGSYDTADVGTGKTVTVTLTGTDYQAIGNTRLADYSLPTTIQGAVGAITKPSPQGQVLAALPTVQPPLLSAEKFKTEMPSQGNTYAWSLDRLVKLSDNSEAGLLSITMLDASESMPAAVAFEQNMDAITLRTAAAPLIRPSQAKLVFSSKLTEFLVADANGKMVEFKGGMINRRLVIVAPSAESKTLAKLEMNTVLAAAVMALGKGEPILLAKLEGVVIDLR